MEVNSDQKPVTLEENVEFNQKLKEYMKHIEIRFLIFKNNKYNLDLNYPSIYFFTTESIS